MAAMNINQKEFAGLMAADKPVLVDFWAPWCGYCRRINEAYDSIAEEYAGRIQVVKVNIDENGELARQEQIELVPTLALYREGKRVGAVVAPESKAEIEKFIGESLPAPEKEQEAHVYDMAVIGGGPGGYTTALYATRAGLDTLVIEKLSAGGQMALTHQIDNYPGFAEGVEGYDLADRMQRQAQRFGAQDVNAEVLSVDLAATPKKIDTSEGVFYARTVVLATGANPRRMGVEKEEALTGRGVAYCAACDGMFYRGKTVAVVGGGNTAAADALLLSRVAKEVIVIHRRDALRATKIYHQPLQEAPNVSFRWNSVVTELLENGRITGLRIKDVKTGEETEIACEGVFVSVGRTPASRLAEGQLALDAGGYIVAGEDTKTSIPGVYAVGDVRTKAVRQVVTAVADGAVAVHMAEEFLTGGDQ